MTFRAKPVVKRSHRPSWQTQDRRNFYLNVGFAIVVLIAVLILAGAAIASWYGEHLSPVAHVNGQAITKDDLRKRLTIENLRLSITERKLATERSAGRLTDAEWNQQEQIVSQNRQQLGQIALERLIDEKVQADLAQKEGITVTPDQVQAQIDKEATSPEQRHAWMIAVEPKVDEGKDAPTAQQKADAKKIADQALADINGGKDWLEVAKSVSTDSSASSGGDLSWITDQTTSMDSDFRDALFKLEVNGRTGVLEGSDGIYRIGRITDIAAKTVDTGYRQSISDNGVSLSDYEAVVRTDLVRIGLGDKIKAEALKAGPQRHVAEIFIKPPTDDQGQVVSPAPDSVKVRHILYSPKDDPQGAATLAADDPAWKKAEDEARAAWQKVKADPSLFPDIARKESDDTQSGASGGSLGYQAPNGGLVEPFANAIFKSGLKAGDILDPVKTQFGWHVIQIMYYPPDLDEAKALKTQAEGGADFAKLAASFSDGAEAAKGGDRGWIARFELSAKLEKAIFDTPIGKVSDPVEIAGEGVYLYKVIAEETRTPEGDQKDTLTNSAFSNWYAAKKADYTISREGDAAAQGN